jgi:uncharacterized protein with PIN domain
LVKLIPECAKCGSSVTDSLEPEVQEHGQLKRGQYVNSFWICNDCIENEKKQKKLSSSTLEQKSTNYQSDNLGVASCSNVSPNTPKADEADL